MHKSRKKIFISVLLVYILAIAVAAFLPEKIIDNCFAFFIVALACACLAFFAGANQQRLTIVFWLLAVFCFGLWRYSIALPQAAVDKIWQYNGQTLLIRGTIRSEVEERPTYQRFELDELILPSQFGKTANGKILISAPLYPSYHYGDRLELTCELAAAENFNGFAYDRYLARYNIFSLCYFPQIKSLGSVFSTNTTSFQDVFYFKIFALKKYLGSIISANLSPDEAGLANAFLLNLKTGQTKEWQNKFSITGLSHIVAISGSHISLLSAILMALLIRIGLNRSQSFYAALAFLSVYLILIGLPASAMRAGLMGGLVLLALKLGRLNKFTNSMLLAAVVMLLFNPRLLRDDVGFQLSFAAIAGIFYIYPKLQNWCEKMLSEKWQRFSLLKLILSIINVTLSAQVFTLPIMAFQFRQISLISPLANLLVVWIAPFAMVSLMLALVLGLVLPAGSLLFFLPAKLCLAYILFITDIFSSVPFAAFSW